MISYVTAVDCIPHCSDKNVVLFSTMAPALLVLGHVRLSIYVT